jgi:cytochrome c oxidase subunit 4
MPDKISNNEQRTTNNEIMTHDTQQHITPYRVYAMVLVTLLSLTFLTIYVAHFHLGSLSIAVALLIACVKATLVLAYFMHLKFDYLIFKVMVAAVILLFASFILLTFVDYWFR